MKQVSISAQCFPLYSYFGESYGFSHKTTWSHNDVTFRHFVNQFYPDVSNDWQLFCVKLVALSTRAFLKFKRRALKGHKDTTTPINAWARLLFAGLHYQPLFGIRSWASQAKKFSSQGRIEQARNRESKEKPG